MLLTSLPHAGPCAGSTASLYHPSNRPKERYKDLRVSLRPFDELAYLERACHELNIEFDWTSEYPTLENASLAAGADACSPSSPTP